MPTTSSPSENQAASSNRLIGLLLTLGGAVMFSCKAIVIKLSYLDYEVESIVFCKLNTKRGAVDVYFSFAPFNF